MATTFTKFRPAVSAIFIVDALAEKAVRAIEESARTGHIGDGKILVYEVTEVIRIRTCERGEAAI